jgi:hypothetical protein
VWWTVVIVPAVSLHGPVLVIGGAPVSPVDPRTSIRSGASLAVVHPR